MTKHLINRIIMIFSGIRFGMGTLMAQSPTSIDTRHRDPKPFSLDDILLYIVAPLAMLILMLWYRYSQNKKKHDRQADDTSE